MYMDNIQLFVKNEKRIGNSNTRSHKIHSQDVGMEYGIEKLTMLVMKNGRRHITDWMEQSNQDKIRTLREKKTNQYLVMLEADTIK